MYITLHFHIKQITHIVYCKTEYVLQHVSNQILLQGAVSIMQDVVV